MISTSLIPSLFALRQNPSTQLPIDLPEDKNSFEDHLELEGAW